MCSSIRVINAFDFIYFVLQLVFLELSTSTCIEAGWFQTSLSLDNTHLWQDHRHIKWVLYVVSGFRNQFFRIHSADHRFFFFNFERKPYRKISFTLKIGLARFLITYPCHWQGRTLLFDNFILIFFDDFMFSRGKLCSHGRTQVLNVLLF